jgi:hypothetical protein
MKWPANVDDSFHIFLLWDPCMYVSGLSEPWECTGGQGSMVSSYFGKNLQWRCKNFRITCSNRTWKFSYVEVYLIHISLLCSGVFDKKLSVVVLSEGGETAVSQHIMTPLAPPPLDFQTFLQSCVCMYVGWLAWLPPPLLTCLTVVYLQF